MTEILHRSFEVATVEVEGRTVDVRVVPFGEVARVADPPNYEPYEEEWLPGCFDHQLKAANRIKAKYGHSDQVTNVVGQGVSLRAAPDGYHVTATIHNTNAGDTTLELLRAGSLPCVSLEAEPKRNIRSGSLVQRAKAHLRAFAFVDEGAFVGAQVLAMRDEPDEPAQTLDAGLLPVDMDPDVVERCRQLGMELPQRYEAHPVDEGTPADAGTPDDDGTRQTVQNTSSEE